MSLQPFGYKLPGQQVSAAWYNSVNSIVHAKTGGSSIKSRNTNMQFDVNDPNSITLDFKQYPELTNAMPGGLVYGNNGVWGTSAEIGGTPYLAVPNALSKETMGSFQEATQWLVKLIPLTPGTVYTFECSEDLYSECNQLPPDVLTQLNQMQAALVTKLTASKNNLNAAQNSAQGSLTLNKPGLVSSIDQQIVNTVEHFNQLRRIRYGDGVLASWHNTALIKAVENEDGEVVGDFAVFKVEPAPRAPDALTQARYLAQAIYRSTASGGGAIVAPAPNETIVRLVCSEETGCRIIEPIIGNFFLGEHLTPLPVDYDNAGNLLLTQENGGQYLPHQFARRVYFNTAGTLACEDYANYDPIRAAWAGGEPHTLKVSDWRDCGFYSIGKYETDDAGYVSCGVKRIRGEAMMYEEKTENGLIIARHPLYLMRREPAVSAERGVIRQGAQSYMGIKSLYLNGTHYGLGDGMNDTYAHSSNRLYAALRTDGVVQYLRDPVDSAESPLVQPISNMYGYGTKPFCIGQPDTYAPDLKWDGKIDIMALLASQDTLYKSLVRKWFEMVYEQNTTGLQGSNAASVSDIFHNTFTDYGALFLQAWENTLIQITTPLLNQLTPMEACLETFNQLIYTPGAEGELATGVIANGIAGVYAATVTYFNPPLPLTVTRDDMLHLPDPTDISEGAVYRIGDPPNRVYYRCENIGGVNEWIHQNDWENPEFVDAQMFQEGFEQRLNDNAYINSIRAQIEQPFMDSWDTVWALFVDTFNQLLREQYAACYDKLLFTIDKAFYETVYTDPDAHESDTGEPWEGTFPNYLAKKLLDVLEDDIRNAIDTAYLSETATETKTVEELKHEEYTRASLFVRQWCDLIYRPHLITTLIGDTSGWTPDMFDEGLQMNPANALAMQMNTLSIPNFTMYFDPEEILGRNITTQGSAQVNILSVFVENTAKWYQSDFERQIQTALLKESVSFQLNPNDYVVALQNTIKPYVENHCTGLLDPLFEELAVPDAVDDIANLVAGDGKYLEIVHVVNSYTDWLADIVKEWMKCQYEDGQERSVLSSWVPPAYQTTGDPQYYELDRFEANAALYLEPMEITRRAANSAFINVRQDAWRDYAITQNTGIPTGDSFIGLFEARKESFRQLYEQVFWLSLSQTMTIMSIPFPFTIGRNEVPVTSLDELNESFDPVYQQVGNTAIVDDNGVQSFYVVEVVLGNLEWVEFSLPTPAEFYACLWEKFQENFNAVFMPEFRKAAYAVYSQFINMFRREYYEQLALHLKTDMIDDMMPTPPPGSPFCPVNVEPYGKGKFWKLYDYLSDTIFFQNGMFQQEKFRDKFYAVSPESEEEAAGDGIPVKDTPVNLIDYLMLKCGSKMATQQNMLQPNQRTTLNYRSVLGLFFRDYVPDEFHKEIRSRLSVSGLGTGWLPGVYQPYYAPSENIDDYDLLGEYTPEFPEYETSWTWNLNAPMPEYDPSGTLLHYAHFETRNKLRLFEAYMNRWSHDTSTPLPTDELLVDTIWERLMLGFIEMLDERFLPFVLADPEIEKEKSDDPLNLLPVYYFRNGRTWRQIESEKWIRALHDSLPEHYARIFRAFFTEVLLIENLPNCRVEPVPPQNWELTLAVEKAQRHNLLAFCPALDPNEILIPGEVVVPSWQTATYRMPAVDMYNRPVRDKDGKRVIDTFTWQYALVEPPSQYTVNMAGTAKVDVYVYEVMDAIVREQIREYQQDLLAYENALAEWIKNGYIGDKPRIPDVDDPAYGDVREKIIVVYEVDEGWNIDQRKPWENVAVSIKQNNKGLIDSRNPYGVVNDLKWKHLRGAFYKIDAMGRKYLCGFRCESIPYGNAIRNSHIVGVSYTETDTCAPVFEPDKTVLIRARFNDRSYLMPAQTTQWVNQIQVLKSPPIPPGIVNLN